MDIQRIKKILKRKEGVRLEFKLASTASLPKNLFESICAMLNREGGDILLGVDGTVTGLLNVVSHYKIDALVRRHDLHRYDDRLYIQTNLIEAYEQLMSFAEKHLPDKFYMHGDQRISLRSHIFREVIANLIIHREYIDAHPSTFIIYADRVEVINANNPHGNGLLLPDTFVPFPKNPLIARFFIQLGRVDELGSGILNVYHYLKEYSPGKKPQFIEDKLFQTIIPIGGIDNTVNTDFTASSDEAVNDAVNDAVNLLMLDRLSSELRLIHKHRGLQLKRIMETFNIRRATSQRDIRLLKDAGLIVYVGPAKTGKYILTEKGVAIFS